METAFRMQTEAPDVFDISKEPEETPHVRRFGSTAVSALMSVRLVERGVRMVQSYYDKGDPWDAHSDIMSLPQGWRRIPTSRSRRSSRTSSSAGLFEDTLVIVRHRVRPHAGRPDRRQAAAPQERPRPQPVRLFVWLAGGGIKGGMTYGATDDFGYKAVENKVHRARPARHHPHLMGIDHTKLTYHYSAAGTSG
jgi:hypothetical protein